MFWLALLLLRPCLCCGPLSLYMHAVGFGGFRCLCCPSTKTGLGGAPCGLDSRSGVFYMPPVWLGVSYRVFGGGGRRVQNTRRYCTRKARRWSPLAHPGPSPATCFSTDALSIQAKHLTKYMNMMRTLRLLNAAKLGQGEADQSDSGGVLPRRRPRRAGAGADAAPEDAGQAPAEGGDDVRSSPRGYLEVPPRAEVAAAGDVAEWLVVLCLVGDGVVGLVGLGPRWHGE